MKNNEKIYWCWFLIWCSLVMSLFMIGYFAGINYLFGEIIMSLISVILTGFNYYFIELFYEEKG